MEAEREKRTRDEKRRTNEGKKNKKKEEIQKRKKIHKTRQWKYEKTNRIIQTIRIPRGT